MGNEKARSNNFAGISVSLSVVGVLHCFCLFVFFFEDIYIILL